MFKDCQCNKMICHCICFLVTRNEEQYIELSLMSLINQTYPKIGLKLLLPMDYLQMVLYRLLRE